jgi:hypothetical protein
MSLETYAVVAGSVALGAFVQGAGAGGRNRACLSAEDFTQHSSLPESCV